MRAGGNYNFAAGAAADAVNLNDGSIPVYDRTVGYGFVSVADSMPERKVGSERIKWSADGFFIKEDGTGSYLHDTCDAHYNYGGLVFRVDVPAGSYRLTVGLSNGSTNRNTTVAPTGMHPQRILASSYWDSAKKVPVRHYARWIDTLTWTYDYVTGEPFIELEVEPDGLGTPSLPKTAGVQFIRIEPLEKSERTGEEFPTVFILGDSTVKTYTFAEAGMSGWGQILGTLFDKSRIRVINYSAGGRSMKAMYMENRFNDLLLSAKPGDFVMLHSAHNDESRGEEKGPGVRFGRGSDDAAYQRWLNDIFIPAIRSRGAFPVLVTPMPRISNGKYREGFRPDSPGLMRAAAAARDDVYLIDLYERAKEYMVQAGPAQITAVYMSVEAGESPGKTNSGSYANGHPDNKLDGTHQKEAVTKVWSRIIAEEILAQSKDPVMKILAQALRAKVRDACVSGRWDAVFPEWTDDVTFATGGDGTAENDPSYYRNQIEKMLQLGVMKKQSGNNFCPLAPMRTDDFIDSLCAVWGLDLTDFKIHSAFEPFRGRENLTREVMAAMIRDAYVLRFGFASDGSFNRPVYMTYNGAAGRINEMTYDPNLTGQKAQYDPLVRWEELTDTGEISPEYTEVFHEAYQLGLVRSEKGIIRGKMMNGTALEPQKVVTRAKAAKELWFLWVLGQSNADEENHILTITTDGKRKDG